MQQAQQYGGQSGGIFGRQFAGAQVSLWLIVANVVIYLIDQNGWYDSEAFAALYYQYGPQAVEWFGGRFWSWGAFTVEGFLGGEIWRALTFQFLHANSFHLFSNMLGLFFFAPHVERFMGMKRFVAFYLLCGVMGPLFLMLVGWLGILPVGGPMIGASAGLFGVLLAMVILAPNVRVLLFFVIPVKLRTAAIGYMAYSVYIVLTNGWNAGGEAAHLGGALAGWLLMKYWVVPKVRGGQRQRVGGYGGGYGGGQRAVGGSGEVGREAKLRPRTRVNLSKEEVAEVDRILDKVREDGLHSLSDEERKVLQELAGRD